MCNSFNTIFSITLFVIETHRNDRYTSTIVDMIQIGQKGPWEVTIELRITISISITYCWHNILKRNPLYLFCLKRLSPIDKRYNGVLFYILHLPIFLLWMFLLLLLYAIVKRIVTLLYYCRLFIHKNQNSYCIYIIINDYCLSRINGAKIDTSRACDL